MRVKERILTFEAHQYLGGGAEEHPAVRFNDYTGHFVEISEDPRVFRRVHYKDWILTDSAGRLSVVSDDLFSKLYEEV